MFPNNNATSIIIEQKCLISRAWFRSTDLWVMGPARSHCATLLLHSSFSGMYVVILTHLFILFQAFFHYLILFQTEFISSGNIGTVILQIFYKGDNRCLVFHYISMFSLCFSSIIFFT